MPVIGVVGAVVVRFRGVAVVWLRGILRLRLQVLPVVRLMGVLVVRVMGVLVVGMLLRLAGVAGLGLSLRGSLLVVGRPSAPVTVVWIVVDHWWRLHRSHLVALEIRRCRR